MTSLLLHTCNSICTYSTITKDAVCTYIGTRVLFICKSNWRRCNKIYKISTPEGIIACSSSSRGEELRSISPSTLTAWLLSWCNVSCRFSSDNYVEISLDPPPCIDRRHYLTKDVISFWLSKIMCRLSKPHVQGLSCRCINCGWASYVLLPEMKCYVFL